MPWTPDQEDALRTLWRAGFTVREIGRQLGVSNNAIGPKASRLGLPAREHPIPQSRPWTDTDVDAMMTLLSEGVGMTEIADQMYRSRDSVKAQFKKACRALGWQAV